MIPKNKNLIMLIWPWGQQKWGGEVCLLLMAEGQHISDTTMSFGHPNSGTFAPTTKCCHKVTTKEIIKFLVIPLQTSHVIQDSVKKMDRLDRLTDKLHQRDRRKERYTGQRSCGSTYCSIYRSCYTEDYSMYWNSCILRATKMNLTITKDDIWEPE